jgi:hypothetical protein
MKRWSQVHKGPLALTRFPVTRKRWSQVHKGPLALTRFPVTLKPSLKRMLRKFHSRKIRKPRIRPIEAMRQIETMKREKREFVDLCDRHIMNTRLAFVNSVVHLENVHSTVYIIGEKHDAYHGRCKEISVMFEELFQENTVMIDFILELMHSDSTREISIPYNVNDIQINNVRNRYQKCIQTRNCPGMRLHWADPTETADPIQEKNIAPWLNALGRYSLGSNLWLNDILIVHNFSLISDIPKLLTENRFIVKEIEYANKVNPAFTMPFAVRLFQEMWSTMLQNFSAKFKREGIRYDMDLNWQKFVPKQLRRVVDFYTAARIISFRMPHVICYVGENHALNIVKILHALEFQTIEQQTFESVPPCF